jgi:hypothetical protein
MGDSRQGRLRIQVMEDTGCAPWDPGACAAQTDPASTEEAADAAVTAVLERREDPDPSLPLPVAQMSVTDQHGKLRSFDVLA